MKDMSFGKKLSYLWDYYKWLVIGTAVMITAGIILVTNYYKASHTNSILEVTLINADALEADQSLEFSEFIATLEDALGDEVVTVDASLSIDLEKQDAVSAASFQVLSAKLLSGDTDILVCDEELFLKEQENNAFLPLDQVLSGEDLERKGDLVTVAGKAYGIRLLGSVLQDGAVYPKDSRLVMGIASTTRDPETAGRFFKWFNY
jgi:hypothetical protein